MLASTLLRFKLSGGPRGYDAGKKINRGKRHALVNTDARALVRFPHP